MRTYLYISDVLEIDKTNILLVDELSPLVFTIADKFDVSVTFLEQYRSYMIMFTYKSPKILSTIEMEYLDTKFENATLQLKSLFIHQKIIIL